MVVNQVVKQPLVEEIRLGIPSPELIEVEQVISALKALASAAAARVVELFPEEALGEHLPRFCIPP